MNFKFVEGDEYNIYLMNKDVEVGRISGDDMIPDHLFERLQTVEEIELVASAERLNEYVHLSEVVIYEKYRYKGYFTKAMELFEQHTKELDFTAITLFTDKSSLSLYKGMGYQELAYLASIDSYLMLKHVVPVKQFI